MLVYGDPKFKCSLRQLLESLAGSLNPEPASADARRRVLIRCGQLEQGIEDLPPGKTAAELRAVSRELTDLAAETFLGIRKSLPRQIALLGQLLKSSAADESLQVKVPEGFEFYSLFPEQYALAAEQWADQWAHEAHGRPQVLVVGIRSIGTSLSAVVRSVLQRRGFGSVRVTVRPAGHPFNRTVDLEIPSGCASAVIVDEGPGLSGSSMVAALQAVQRSGIKQIAFMPAHANMPGAAVSPQVMECWRQTPRFVASAESVSFSGSSLESLLQTESQRISRCEAAGPLVSVGGGEWRRQLEASQNVEAIATPCLERAKYLWNGRTGAQLLWKFEGLGSWKSIEDVAGMEPGRDTRPHSRCVPVIATLYGFVAYPWLKGVRPAHGVLTTHDTLRILGRYISSRAGPALAAPEQKAAVRCLEEMARFNAAEWLVSSSAQKSFDSALDAAMSAQPGPAYGDGRMAPWEWVLNGSGQLLKTDWQGHNRDHTLIGQQSFMWDVAGTIVEWRLESGQAAALLEECQTAGLDVSGGADNLIEELLRFYQLAYASFRYGVCSMCGEPGSAERYASALTSLVHEAPGCTHGAR